MVSCVVSGEGNEEEIFAPPCCEVVVEDEDRETPSKAAAVSSLSLAVDVKKAVSIASRDE